MSQCGSPERLAQAQYFPFAEMKNTLVPFRCSIRISGLPPIELIKRLLALSDRGTTRLIYVQENEAVRSDCPSLLLGSLENQGQGGRCKMDLILRESGSKRGGSPC